MPESYRAYEIETKWQQRWIAEGLHTTVVDSSRPKWYALTMFVYPSGDLHAGHWYAFAPSDAAARWRRMNGYNVFFPVGFDAFGLPAENAAIKRNIHPKAWTYGNMDRMRKQLRRMGAMWAWDHEVVTCDPEYYKWTQWLFLKFYDAGLAYRECSPVDWCPSCNTTLAREQVWGEDRHCERCNTPVVKKELLQWKFRITKYADELLRFDGCEWPERVRLMQTNWIGRSEGAQVSFSTEYGHSIDIFTTRPDTLWGVTFLVLAPEHPLVAAVTTDENRSEVEAYKAAASRINETLRAATSKEKTGVFSGTYAVNPVNGERIPIWIADYVMMGYGTGAIMAVPAHDDRDFAFAKKHNINIRRVICGPDGDMSDLECAWTSTAEGKLVNSGPFDGVSVAEAAPQVAAWLEQTDIGRRTVNYRLRDWLISRQRMWGAPIPIIYCPNCGTVPVPYEGLPVLLPDNAQFQPTGESPLKSHDTFRFVKCPQCGTDAERETDTMDTFLCSSWYQYGYVSPYHKQRQQLQMHDLPWDKSTGNYWLPVDQYTGGIEHATMHLLYTRFFTKALRDIGLVDFEEPMQRLFNQGMILGPDGEKMSKSRGNVVNPDEMVEKYGADTVRGYVMFIGPWDQGGPWDLTAIEGVHRFLWRVWNLVEDKSSLQNPSGDSNSEQAIFLCRKMHQAVIKVTEDMEKFRFNTVISTLMEFSGVLAKAKDAPLMATPIWQETVSTLLLLMAPIFPHISEELWHRMGRTTSIHLERWPRGDQEKATEDQVTVVVQVNGKIRDRLVVPMGTDRKTLEDQALASETVRKSIGGVQVRKVIVVPNKLVNIVVK